MANLIPKKGVCVRHCLIDHYEEDEGVSQRHRYLIGIKFNRKFKISFAKKDFTFTSNPEELQKLRVSKEKGSGAQWIFSLPKKEKMEEWLKALSEVRAIEAREKYKTQVDMLLTEVVGTFMRDIREKIKENEPKEIEDLEEEGGADRTSLDIKASGDDVVKKSEAENKTEEKKEQF
eukprot:TRINITY_DN10822_c0_g3_i2.p1 TRINITY_DN10822_c0_g3~~TRINITY_DN10822_c0_g3_i2.p1  ORF type:complete len:176 (+),score=37.46 TRINITY_DN10822_c0_g3_i2:390-917(+)